MLAAGPIQALIFDIGHVIVRVNAQRAAKALARSAGITAEDVLATIGANARLRDFQEGRLSPREWPASSCPKIFPDPPISIERIASRLLQ